MSGPRIRPATPEDLAALPALELAADRLLEAALGDRALPAPGFPASELPASELPASEPLTADGPPFFLVACLVGGAPPVGFARVDEVDGQAHLEQLSVHPDFAWRGLGRSLVEAAIDAARSRGYALITLCTFADVPFNAPFYARCGFEVVTAPSGQLAALRTQEAELGLDDLGRRVVMQLRL